MKFERLLKIPRSGRAIQLVINIPEPSVNAPPVSAPAKITLWGRIWAFLRIAGPAFIAIAALTVSVLGFLEQKSTDQVAATAAEEQEAAKVSFLLNGSPSHSSVLIENLSQSPVYNVTLVVYALPPKAETGTFTLSIGFGAPFSLNNIPACHSGAVDLTQKVAEAVEEYSNYKPSSGAQLNATGLTVESMYFSDDRGLDWEYSSVGALVKLDSLPEFTRNPSVQVVYVPATGCS